MNWLTSIKNNKSVILAVLLVLSFIFQYKQCTDYKHDLHIAENNIVALTDTVKQIKTKNGEIVFEKKALEGELKDIKTLNEELYNKISSLKKDLKLKKDIITAMELQGEIINEVHDTVYTVLSTDGSWTKDFDFSNDYRTLRGYVQYKSPDLKLGIIEDKMFIKYTLMIDENNNVYAHSDNPNIAFNQMDMFVLPKEKKHRFSIGPYIGVGYDFSNNKIAPQIGIGIQYSIIKF